MALHNIHRVLVSVLILLFFGGALYELYRYSDFGGNTHLGMAVVATVLCLGTVAALIYLNYPPHSTGN